MNGVKYHCLLMQWQLNHVKQWTVILRRKWVVHQTPTLVNLSCSWQKDPFTSLENLRKILIENSRILHCAQSWLSKMMLPVNVCICANQNFDRRCDYMCVQWSEDDWMVWNFNRKKSYDSKSSDHNSLIMSKFKNVYHVCVKRFMNMPFFVVWLLFLWEVSLSIIYEFIYYMYSPTTENQWIHWFFVEKICDFI